MPDSILLYRFLSAEAALKTLERVAFKVSRLNELNDPFEWRLGVTGILPEGEKIAEACVKQIVDHLNSWFGIICFSDTSSEPVLWSHYADKHRGIALEV